MSPLNAGGGGVDPSKAPLFYLQVSPSGNVVEVARWIGWARAHFNTLTPSPDTYTFFTAIRQGHNDWYRTQMRYLKDHWQDFVDYVPDFILEGYEGDAGPVSTAEGCIFQFMSSLTQAREAYLLTPHNLNIYSRQWRASWWALVEFRKSRTRIYTRMTLKRQQHT